MTLFNGEQIYFNDGTDGQIITLTARGEPLVVRGRSSSFNKDSLVNLSKK